MPVEDGRLIAVPEGEAAGHPEASSEEPQEAGRGATRLVRWRPGTFEGELLALRAQVWGADHPHTSAAFFAWLFGEENPAGEGGGVLLHRGNQVLGFMGFSPRLARVGGQDVRVAHCLDYMVDRRLSATSSGRYALRLATEWTKAVRAEGFAFGIGYPNENSRRIVTSPRIGWREIMRPRLLVRPLSGARRASGPSALRLGLLAGSAVLDLGARLARRPEGAARLLDLDEPADAAAVDALWMRRRDDRPAGLYRDAAALRWRYARHPLRRYRILGWEGRDGLSALVVTTRRDLGGVASVLVVDAIGDPASIAQLRALVGAALQEAATDGACLAVGEAERGTALARALAAARFVPVPRRFDPKPFTLVGLPLAEAFQTTFQRPWQFGWGDMDVV